MMNEHLILIDTVGDIDNFTANYEHTETGLTGQLQFIKLGNEYSVFGELHTGETIEETVVIEASSAPTPKQIFWLVAEVLKALLCPECGDKTNPE